MPEGKPMMAFTLRPDQQDVLGRLDQMIERGARRIVVQAPTGWGKTVLAAAVVEKALAEGKRVAFIVPALSLIDQTVDRFYAAGLRDIGVMQADHPLTNAARPLQICSIQTLERRMLPDADLVLVDEAHKVFKRLVKWMAAPATADIPFVGLTATPWTKGLGKYYKELLIASTTAELIEAGILAKFRVFAPGHPDLSAVRTVAGDYHEGDLSKAMDRPELVADIVQTWMQRGADRPSFVFAVDRAHAKTLQRQFQAAGIATEYIDAYTERQERERIRLRFQAGEIKVVCNVGCLTTGVDWDVRCIVLARPTKSEILFVQMIGRGLRTAPGKPDCLILDHSDTHQRLGFVTDIVHGHLDDGTARISGKRDKPTSSLPKLCPKCSYLRPPKVHECPACGFAPELRSDIRPAAGDLIEVTRPLPPSIEERQRWYSGLLYIAHERSYREGFAAYKFKEKFGAWPNGLGKYAREPDRDILNWVRSRQIAFAKGRAA
jgi:superfamily II DNA or RNA helicase